MTVVNVSQVEVWPESSLSSLQLGRGNKVGLAGRTARALQVLFYRPMQQESAENEGRSNDFDCLELKVILTAFTTELWLLYILALGNPGMLVIATTVILSVCWLWSFCQIWLLPNNSDI